MQIFNRIVLNECNDEWVMNMKIDLTCLLWVSYFRILIGSKNITWKIRRVNRNCCVPFSFVTKFFSSGGFLSRTSALLRQVILQFIQNYCNTQRIILTCPNSFHCYFYFFLHQLSSHSFLDLHLRPFYCLLFQDHKGHPTRVQASRNLQWLGLSLWISSINWM